MQSTNYGNSYMTLTDWGPGDDPRKPGHMPWPNLLRILLDSRCWITDGDSGETREYNMISPCRTEWMYRDDILWQVPDSEFAGVYSDSEWMAMKRARFASSTSRSSVTAPTLWPGSSCASRRPCCATAKRSAPSSNTPTSAGCR